MENSIKKIKLAVFSYIKNINEFLPKPNMENHIKRYF